MRPSVRQPKQCYRSSGLDSRAASDSGAISTSAFGPAARVKTIYEELKARPDILAEARAILAGELAETDGGHDGFGGALWFLAEAVRRCPSCTAEQRAAAERIQTELVTGLAELRRTYVKEAVAARQRRKKLPGLEAALRTLPTPDGRTAYDWAEDYVAAGEKLQQLLDQRSLQKAGEAEAPAEAPAPAAELSTGALRNRIVQLLAKARDVLADELGSVSNQLPANADALVFGPLDELVAGSARPAKPAAQPAQPEIDVPA